MVLRIDSANLVQITSLTTNDFAHLYYGKEWAKNKL